MNARKPAPIGPFAIALRHLRSPGGRRGVVVVVVILALSLIVGIALQFLR